MSGEREFVLSGAGNRPADDIARGRPPRIAPAIFLTSVAVLLALLSCDTVPRFDATALNYASAIALAIAIPASLTWIAALRSRPLHWTAGVAIVLVWVPFGLFTLFASIELSGVIADGLDTGFEPVAELQGTGVRYRLYLTDGGATTSYGLVLRRERPILPGVILVTVLHSDYRAHDATMVRLANGRARLDVLPYNDGDPHRIFVFDP